MQTMNVFHRSMTMCERAYVGGLHGTVAGSRDTARTWRMWAWMICGGSGRPPAFFFPAPPPEARSAEGPARMVQPDPVFVLPWTT